jgi:hypothetical protein
MVAFQNASGADVGGFDATTKNETDRSPYVEI